MFLMRAATASSEIGPPCPGDRRRRAQRRDAGRPATATPSCSRASHSPPRRAISFDHAVMEKTDLAAVVAARFDWSDVGTWAIGLGRRPTRTRRQRRRPATRSWSRPGILVSSDASEGRRCRHDDVVVVAADDAVLVTTRANVPRRSRNWRQRSPTRRRRVIGDFVRHYRPWGHYQSLTWAAPPGQAHRRRSRAAAVAPEARPSRRALDRGRGRRRSHGRHERADARATNASGRRPVGRHPAGRHPSHRQPRRCAR